MSEIRNRVFRLYISLKCHIYNIYIGLVKTSAGTALGYTIADPALQAVAKPVNNIGFMFVPIQQPWDTESMLVHHWFYLQIIQFVLFGTAYR